MPISENDLAANRRPMILAIDSSSAACTVALLTSGGELHAALDERIGRGHAERLAPMIDELLAGHVPTRILVGIGPGSFTGIRVGLAAAQGLSIGWGVELHGVDSLALMAASSDRRTDEPVAVAINGGHGELFVRTFDGRSLEPLDGIRSLTPDAAAEQITAPLVVGSGAEALVSARGHGAAFDVFPSAARVLELPEALRSMDPKPAYARAPDARPKVAA
jgi:tRNA threonylcarbamoyl adenosine modification protein YeaZ